MRTGRALPGRIRIIGGHWRGRKIQVSSSPGLRPTPDRVRETLFNWLQNIIEGANCLDLYAGTGVLGLEAASRGANRVVMVECDPDQTAQLRRQVEVLDAGMVEVVQAEALSWLSLNRERFDIVFLDPPFAKNLLAPSCDLLLNSGHLHRQSRVYIESEPGLSVGGLLGDRFELFRQARAGQVEYSLWTCTELER